jgi:hypothetical protein
MLRISRVAEQLVAFQEELCSAKLADCLVRSPHNSFSNISLLLSLEHRTSVKRLVSLQFLNLIDSRQDSLDGRSARRKASTYTEQQKHTRNADRHPFVEQDSNLRPQCLSWRRQFRIIQ